MRRITFLAAHLHSLFALLCWKFKFILSVDQGISQVSNANERDILFNARNKFHISKHPCIVLFIIIIKKMPYKNRAVYSNVFYDGKIQVHGNQVKDQT